MNCTSLSKNGGLYFWLRPIALMFLILNAACNNSPLSSGSDYVVVDIVSVARAMGRDEIIQQKLEEANSLLNSQLTEITRNLQQQLQDEQSKLDKSNTEHLNNLNVQTQLQLRRTQLLAKQKAEQYRSQLLLEFRQEVLDAAKPIAKKKGADSVQLANNNLLWYAPSIDITGDVIAALRASGENQAKAEKTAAPKDQSQAGETKPKTTPKQSKQVDQLNQLMRDIDQEKQQQSGQSKSPER